MAKFTPQQVQEWIKCKNDYLYFITNYILIEIAGGDVPFTLYGKQRELLNELNKWHYMVTLKTRQTGISTTIQAYCAWLLIFYENVGIGVVSKDNSEATSFARSIRGMIEKLPRWMTPKFTKHAEQSFILANGGKVFSATVNPNEPTKTLRGKPITFLVLDEAAFTAKIDEAWTAMVPALSTSQRHARLNKVPYGTMVISTPNKTTGIGKWYYERWSGALNTVTSPDVITDAGEFRPFVVYWRDIPELAQDPLWYKTQCNMFDGDQRKIDQELELKFIPSSGSFFDQATCSILQENTRDLSPKHILKLFNGEVWVFEEPKPNKYYLIGVDTASEYGNDRSAITIWDYENLEQVWEYQGKIPVTDFEKVVDYACAQYQGTLVVERNSYGNQIVEHMERSNFYTMLYKQKVGEQLKNGLTTDMKTRPLMIDALYSYISQFPQMVKSKRLAIELVGLVTKKSGKVEADDGCNDDLALTLAFCAYVRKYDPPLMLEFERTGDDILQAVIGMNLQISETRADLQSSTSMDAMNAKIMRMAKEDVTDFTKSFVSTLDYYQR